LARLPGFLLNTRARGLLPYVHVIDLLQKNPIVNCQFHIKAFPPSFTKVFVSLTRAAKIGFYASEFHINVTRGEMYAACITCVSP
jgi:hypothetical protein